MHTTTSSLLGASFFSRNLFRLLGFTGGKTFSSEVTERNGMRWFSLLRLLLLYFAGWLDDRYVLQRRVPTRFPPCLKRFLPLSLGGRSFNAIFTLPNKPLISPSCKPPEKPGMGIFGMATYFSVTTHHISFLSHVSFFGSRMG